MEGYELSNGKVYKVEFRNNKIYVTEYSERFKGMFLSESDVTIFDEYRDVKEYLKEKNGGVEI